MKASAIPAVNNPPVIWTPRGLRLIKTLSFVLILVVGLVLRLDPLIDWLEHPELALYRGEPLLTTFDGYYYLTLARDLLEGSWGAVDHLRAVPDYPAKPFPPPLMPMLAAGTAWATSLSLNWVGVLLPAFLGVLLAFPMYGLGKHFGGTFMGLSSALISMVSPYYIQRSGLGWFDTDCLLVTLAVSATWLFLKFATIRARRRYGFLAAGLAVSLITVWWWDQTPQIAVLVTAAPLALALPWHYRPARRGEWAVFSAIALLWAGALLVWQGQRFPLEVVQQVLSQFHYVSKASGGAFPNIGVTISEQERLPFVAVVQATLGDPVILLLAVIGLAWLVWRHPRDSLLLLPLLGLGAMALLFAGRFLIYVAPAAGIGMGYLASRVWRMGRGRPALVFVAPALVLAAAIPGYRGMLQAPRFPHELPVVIDGMDRLRQQTPENAVVWAWWDHGYPLNYWARRATVNDGQVHGGERSVYNALPLVTSSDRLAANFMQFQVTHGLKGFRAFYDAAGGPVKGYERLLRILHLGPERGEAVLRNAGIEDTAYWLRYLFPETSRPIYLFLDWRLTQISYWWYWLGSWDSSDRNGIHPYHRTFLGVRQTGRKLESSGVAVDLDKGEARVGNAVLPIKSFHSDAGADERFDHEDGANVDYSAERKMLVISDGYFNESVFNRLFTYGRGEGRWLTVESDESPAWQIIRVNPDHYPGQ
ncbi:MAG TPA: hypothetical protein ENK26_03150 [Gammaproteobacteria bacterium]|nr:hypothetical protein [Gammaproteobacteria bacterium]